MEFSPPPPADLIAKLASIPQRHFDVVEIQISVIFSQFPEEPREFEDEIDVDVGEEHKALSDGKFCCYILDLPYLSHTLKSIS